MKKTGVVAGISFLAGALFIALFFGYFQNPKTDDPKPSVKNKQEKVEKSPVTDPAPGEVKPPGSEESNSSRASETTQVEPQTFTPTDSTGNTLIDENLSLRDQGQPLLNFAPLVKKVRPAVVKVMPETRALSRKELMEQFFGSDSQRGRRPGIGSGFFISNDGYI
ncbi:MAG: hypothetical protein GY940_01680, partial [bacterium]|nr:hypothetical protein [bacterium]